MESDTSVPATLTALCNGAVEDIDVRGNAADIARGVLSDLTKMLKVNLATQTEEKLVNDLKVQILKKQRELFTPAPEPAPQKKVQEEWKQPAETVETLWALLTKHVIGILLSSHDPEVLKRTIMQAKTNEISLSILTLAVDRAIQDITPKVDELMNRARARKIDGAEQFSRVILKNTPEKDALRARVISRLMGAA